MRIVIAPDKFRDSLDAPAVGAALEAGIRTVDPDVDLTVVPMADGGEGTIDAAISSGFARHSATVTGPLGEPIEAVFALQGSEAVIELASASGLALVPRAQRDALRATSRGTGELILAALDLGARFFTLAIGGSASTDGGSGMLTALGARLLGADGEELPAGGGSLGRLERVDLSALDERLSGARFTLASDVNSPLLGPHGAAATFGPQKGASAAEVAQLELGLTRYVHRLVSAVQDRGCPTLPTDPAEKPGAGAAGGVGFAAIAVLGAEQRPGVDVLCELTRLRAHLAGADLVVTGEGSFDEQSLAGKTPIGVARAANTLDIPTVVVCGRNELSEREWREAGVSGCYVVQDRAPDRASSIRDAAHYLSEIGAEVARDWEQREDRTVVNASGGLASPPHHR
ncbi:glycerate kinase [Leucobacter sp. USHLN153]|uniref:glycerate kinase n=1 Tax=Leucobacter sp. USHLN153 TaxID=3081268 RepID=UPI00301A07CD